jgi:cytochrome c oxidase assembly factor CtaG
MGATEILIILAIVLLLFGAPVLTFLLGYTVGRRRAQSPPSPADVAAGSSTPKEPDDE